MRSCLWGVDLGGDLHRAGGIGGLLVESVRSETSNDNTVVDYLPHCDGNGNVVGAARASDGALMSHYEYGSFGEPVRVAEAAPSTRFRFSSRYSDAYDALPNFGRRYYHPLHGVMPPMISLCSRFWDSPG